MLNNPRQRTRFRAFWLLENEKPPSIPDAPSRLICSSSSLLPYEARDATAIVRPDFDNGVLLQVLLRLLLCRLLSGGQIVPCSAVPLRSTAKAMNLIIGTEFFSQSGSLHSAAILTPLPLFLRGL
jgi:hypothetical protein